MSIIPGRRTNQDSPFPGLLISTSEFIRQPVSHEIYSKRGRFDLQENKETDMELSSHESNTSDYEQEPVDSNEESLVETEPTIEHEQPLPSEPLLAYSRTQLIKIVVFISLHFFDDSLYRDKERILHQQI